VAAVGGPPELGCWQPSATKVRMVTDAQRFPVWAGEVELPSGTAVEYKYVICNEHSNEVKWELEIGNRMFTPEGVSVVLEDGRFNVERARLLDKEQRKVAVDSDGRAGNRCNEYIDVKVTLDARDVVYVVSYRLPLTVSRDPQTGTYRFEWRRGPGGESTSVRHSMYVIERLRKLRSRMQIWYVGWLGVDIPQDDREAVAETLKRDFQCLPVFLPPAAAKDFKEFCDQVLRPIFHFGTPSTSDLCRSFIKDQDWEGGAGTAGSCALPAGPDGPASASKWMNYTACNRAYIEPLVGSFNDGDLVMTFDVELLMLPSLVGSRCRSANLLFVFNTPFPSSDIFRALPVRKDIMRSLLNCDMLYFQCFTYARHFLTSCSRLLGLEYHPMRGGLIQVTYLGHRVHVRANHVGLDTDSFLSRFHSDPTVARARQSWQETLGDSKVVLGYDDLEPWSGITLKLQAFKSMIRLFPRSVDEARMVLVATPLTDSEGRQLYQDYLSKVQALVDEINAIRPGLVTLFMRKMSFAERTALFSVSDVMVNSSVRHGLNLMPFEFILCGSGDCDGGGGGRPGGFVVSEFLGCSRVLPGAVRTNPWRDEDLARAIYRLLLQPNHEKEYWHQLQMQQCRTNAVLRWAVHALVDMKRMRELLTDLGEDVLRAGCRVGIAKMPHREMSTGSLKTELVYRAYSSSVTRLIVADIDVLLRPILNAEAGATETPTTSLLSKQDLLKSLRDIAEHEGNIVFLLSSGTPAEVRQMLGEGPGLEKFGIGAEDGYCYKWPGSPMDRWDIRTEVTTGWKDVALGLMREYQCRTNGSYIDEDKVSSATWHFDRANPEFGALQGKELQVHLHEMLAHFPVQVVMGMQYVRVRHEGVNKGTFLEHVMKHYNIRGGVDFLLAIADDVTDEELFQVILAYHRDAQYRVVSGSGTMREVKVFPCTVGRQPSSATHCIYNAEEVVELFNGLFLQNKRQQRAFMRSRSAIDFNPM